jgi:hypothetical protein
MPMLRPLFFPGCLGHLILNSVRRSRPWRPYTFGSLMVPDWQVSSAQPAHLRVVTSLPGCLGYLILDSARRPQPRRPSILGWPRAGCSAAWPADPQLMRLTLLPSNPRVSPALPLLLSRPGSGPAAGLLAFAVLTDRSHLLPSP